MLGATFGVVGSISETADATDSETADAADSTPGLELTVSGITPPVAISAAGSEDTDSTFAAGADRTVAK